MSQENVEVVRRVYEVWNAGDMDAFRELCDPDIIMRPPEGWPEPGPFVGREAVMREWYQLRETWDADAVEPISDFIDAADRVVVRQVWHGVGSGPESHLETTNVFTLRKGRIFYQEFFWDHAAALEAAGLGEKAMSQENVETTHRFTEALVRGDYKAAATELGPNVEIDDTDIPESTGADSFYAWLARWDGSWESWRIEDLEIRPVGDDRTISLFKMIVRGKGSGIELARDDAALAEFRDGKIVRIGYYNDQAQALEAAGLRE